MFLFFILLIPYPQVCIVGRVCFAEACAYVTGITNANFESLLRETGFGTSAELQKQEELRTSLMFATNIIASEDRDCRSIPAYIKSNFEANGGAATSALLGLVGLIHRIGQAQLVAVSTNFRSPILSPLIISSILKFLEEFYAVYINCDFSELLIDEDLISPVVETMLQLVLISVRCFPSQSDLVGPASQLLHRLSHLGIKDDQISERKDKLNQLLKLPIISEIYSEVIGCSVVNSSGTSRLNSEGIAKMFQGLGTIIGNGGDTHILTQICSTVHKKFEQICESVSSKSGELKPLFDQNLSYLHGLSRVKLNKFDINSSCNELLAVAMDTCIPMVCRLLDAKYDQYDDVLQTFMTLLSDYSSVQIQTLSSKSSVIVFQAAIHSMKTLSTRMSRAATSSTISAQAKDVEELFRSQMISILLRLLNNLSDRDFTVENTESVNVDAESPLILQTLFLGLQSVVPFITVDILSSFPETAYSYFKFLLYLSRVYIIQFSSFLMQMSDQGFRLMEVLFEQVLWAAGAIDSTVARLALESIYCICEHQLTADAGQVLPLQPTARCNSGYSTLYNRLLERLMSMLLLADTKTLSSSISWDRLDSASNAILCLISINYSQFQAIVQAIMASHTSGPVKDAILSAFQKLLSSDNSKVNFTNVKDMKTREAFAKNLREFVKQIRPLMTYK